MSTIEKSILAIKLDNIDFNTSYYSKGKYIGAAAKIEGKFDIESILENVADEDLFEKIDNNYLKNNISKYFKPQFLYDEDELSEWALNNGFVKKE